MIDMRTFISLLISIGSPFLFALKIIIWTFIYVGNLTINCFSKLFHVFLGSINIIIWLLKTIIEASQIFLKKNKIPHIKIPRIPIPKFQPPRIRIPKVSIPAFPIQIPQAVVGFIVCFILLFVPYWTKTQLDKLPNPKLLTARDIPVSTKIYDRNGVLLYSFYGDENRSPISLSAIPKYLIDATIAIEDKNFYNHFGFDIKGIIRAAFSNTNGSYNQGGSTITQQLIKSALLTPEKNITRKIKEVFLAFWAERIYSKNEILSMYLNQVSYGGTSYGVEAASQTYFGKSAKDLALAQAALLAGLPSSPTTYSPFGSHPELTKARQKQVLEAMVSAGYITQFQAQSALSEEIVFNSFETGIKAPHFVMYVKDYLTQKYGSRIVERGGLEVHTTLDYGLYEKVVKILKNGIDAQKYLRVGNGAVLITNPTNGEILTMVGSTDFFNTKNDGNVNVTVALRSPGSSIKPLTYALGFEKNIITPASILDDNPVVYKSAGNSYAPQNYDNKFHGKVSARVALGSSYNIPAVRVLEKVGVTNFLDFAKTAGITSFTDYSRYGLAVTLGGGEVTMFDMATAYSMFPNNGIRVDLTPVTLVKDYRGKIYEQSTFNSQRVISSRTAFLINNILSDDSARAPTFGSGSQLNIPGHTVAVKTGTAETKRDNWTIGYTPNFLVAVWVGNNDNSPMSPFLESGNTGAAAIWSPIMKELLTNQPNVAFEKPDDLISVTICALNGLLPCENCPYLKTEFFAKGTEPKQACNITKEELDKIQHPEEEKKQ